MKKRSVRKTLLLKLAVLSMAGASPAVIHANSLSSAAAQAIPSNAVVAFDGACPSGWSSFGKASGRTILGSGRLYQNYRGQTYDRTYNRGERGGYRAYRLKDNEIPSNAVGFSAERERCNFKSPAGCGSDKTSKRTQSGYGSAFDNQGPYIVLNYCKKN